MTNSWDKSTICVRGGYVPKNGEPSVMPLYQSTTYKYDTSDSLAAVFDLEEEGHSYTRVSNPTIAALEQKLTSLEGGVGAVATASGLAAIMLAVLNICSSGDNLLCSSTVYGGTYNLFSVRMKEFGIEVIFVNPDSKVEELINLANDKTKLIYAESIGNPAINVLNFEAFSRAAKQLKVPLVVDNTLASPYLCHAFEHGANIIVHSTTKYIEGHANSIGGIIIDGGNFDWQKNKFPQLVEPDLSYHGISYIQKFGELAYITKARTQLLRDYGCCMSPFNAYMTNIGLETLHLRMKQHSENALIIAKWLSGHKYIDWVRYPGLCSDENYKRAQKYLPKGSGGIITFGIRGGIKAAKQFITNVKLVMHVTHLADVRSCVTHPASTTHRQLNEKQQRLAGVTPELIRLSVGIENVVDIITDLEQALSKIKSVSMD
ncbi:bifunctional O-acetylhomoserine aminocarboxypropyltransferase/cysteine synthase [Bacillus toyonensis]|uniref:bifunctional O-acetylhomoserine aminocarboxypropyltransferase/cysteine synthase n=1 Tax=Bacillus toyonensis TaxID=155322 RepID=UPI000BF1D8D7|nr:bifunctional O-acetylhomoserine aminocarboxypropyltransferase/cysteine synthase [Bacillus toyonensis]PEK74874.1 O-acetylhomoserine aminocarboxypropyltransferase [Bacillus toyonensis]PEO48330.1 O-acetylhomoserine aminocarboxypropyltransferase [Bacillus toyonensis]PFY32783.1 O-acetylhomoserine aminocarboxypropyltransferase [Bacillus toyonensis]PFY41825.1 O-acetylhomoserine aminocarboxypropyltransferase [Bacillus toyonensis]PGD09893.1 O-acetylhomoserine aminocarboxypropyltransferase [Bacillus 